MENFHRIAVEILRWAEEKNFKGSDPYDGLNSRLLSPFLNHSRFLRLATIQAVKKSPINLRKVLLVPEGYNPKGLALFLSGLSYLSEIDTNRTAEHLEQMILSLASKPDGMPAFSRNRAIRTDIKVEKVAAAIPFGWGYNFPWQSKAFFQPAWFPTVVCSSFILDAFQNSKSKFYPAVARSLACLIEKSLNVYRDESGICFSYSSQDNTRVYNASLFAAKILARAAEFDEENGARYKSLAKEACNYVQNKQRDDGSWIYGEADHWQWVDNLHTGFVLETLNSIAHSLQTTEYENTIVKGLNCYRTNLFTDDGTAKYFNNNLYPLDPHSFAQGAITLLELNQRQEAEKVLKKAIELLWDEKRKGFIFQKQRNYSIKQVHLRWSQGWMFKALCKYLKDNE